MANKKPLYIENGRIQEYGSGDTIDPSIAPGSGGGGGSISIELNGVEVVSEASTLNFSGSVAVTDAGSGKADINVSGGGGGGSTSEPGSFNANPSQTAAYFSSDFFGGTCIYIPDTVTIKSVKVFGRVASSFARMTPAIYSSSASGNLSTLIASGPSVVGLKLGINELPLSAPITISGGTFVFGGFVLTNDGISVARARAPSSVFFSVFSPTPPTNPSASTGLSEWSSMWLGT